MARALYLKGRGTVIGLDRFGVSALYQVLFKHFGFAVGNVVWQARALIG